MEVSGELYAPAALIIFRGKVGVGLADDDRERKRAGRHASEPSRTAHILYKHSKINRIYS
jgi:hypothetical protein